MSLLLYIEALFVGLFVSVDDVVCSFVTSQASLLLSLFSLLSRHTSPLAPAWRGAIRTTSYLSVIFSAALRAARRSTGV